MSNPTNKTISSLSELQAEMRLVKTRVREKETGLAERVQKLPGEALKAAAAAIVPLFIGGEMATGAWKIVKGAFELFKAKKSGDSQGKGGDWKADLLGGAQKLGIFGALRLLFGLWKGK